MVSLGHDELNTMGADVIMMQGTRASAAIALIELLCSFSTRRVDEKVEVLFPLH